MDKEWIRSLLRTYNRRLGAALTKKTSVLDCDEDRRHLWESQGFLEVNPQQIQWIDMGRRKIAISKIRDVRSQRLTFYKRKNGLLKKAIELSILCDVDVLLIIADKRAKRHTVFNSGLAPESVIGKITEKATSREIFTKDDYSTLYDKKGSSEGERKGSSEELDQEKSQNEATPEHKKTRSSKRKRKTTEATPPETVQTKKDDLEKKLKAKREKLTIAIPEDNGVKLPYQIPTSNNKLPSSSSVNLEPQYQQDPLFSQPGFSAAGSKYAPDKEIIASPLFGLFSPFMPSSSVFREDNNSARLSAFKPNERPVLYSPLMSSLEPRFTNNPQ